MSDETTAPTDSAHFPKMLYRPGTASKLGEHHVDTHIVNDTDELEAAIDDGWHYADDLLANEGAEPGVLDHSIKDIIALLGTIDNADEVQKLIDDEIAGKSRDGAIKALEARRDELLAA